MRVVVAVVLLLTACASPVAEEASTTARPSQPPVAQTPDAAPSRPAWLDRTPSPECVNPPPDVMTLIFQSDPVACYGNADLTVEGVVLSSLGVVDCAFLVEPAWLSCSAGRGLEAILSASEAGSIVLAATSGGPMRAPSEWRPPWLWFVLAPDSGIPPHAYDGMTVRATGHYDDPAAQTCRITDDYTNTVTPAEAVDSCRFTFVVTDMVPAEQ